MIYQLKITMVFGAYMPEDATVERVMEADGSSNLRDLIFKLLNSLDFDFDHLYEYKIGKNKYSGSPLKSDGKNPTFDELKLRKGSKFRLVYDFGDDWTFDIVVVEKREGTVEHGIEVISSKGTVEQYPDFDDWEDDEDYEGLAELSEELSKEHQQLADELEAYEDLVDNGDESAVCDWILELWPKIKAHALSVAVEASAQGILEDPNEKISVDDLDPSWEMGLWDILMETDLPFLNERRYEEGIKLWSDILDTFQWEEGENAQLKGAIGEALARLGEKEKVTEHFALWEKESPKSFTRMNYHLLALEDLEDWDTARERLEEYLKSGENAKTYDVKELFYERAIEIYQALGDKNKADYYTQKQKKLRAEMKKRMSFDQGMFSPQPVAPNTIVRSEPKVYRNDPCPCGSGKKYKNCCGK